MIARLERHVKRARARLGLRRRQCLDLSVSLSGTLVPAAGYQATLLHHNGPDARIGSWRRPAGERERERHPASIAVHRWSLEDHSGGFRCLDERTRSFAQTLFRFDGKHTGGGAELHFVVAKEKRLLCTSLEEDEE